MTNEWNYVIAAYVVTWVVVGGYALYLVRGTRRAEIAYDAARRAAPGGGGNAL
jgi:CcmD family protein